MLRLKKLLPLLAMVLVCAMSLPAQKKSKEDAGTRSVTGTVFDPDDKAVSGAVVQLKDTKTLQIRSFLTKDDGVYHFSGLKTDVDYQVMAKSGDLSSPTRTISVFDTRQTPVLNLKLEKK